MSPFDIFARFEIFEIEVFPNPSSDIIHVLWDEEIKTSLQLSLFTPTGELVLEKILRSGREAELNIGSLRAGSYFLVLSGEDISDLPIKILKF